MQPDNNYEVFNEEIEVKLKEIGHLIGDKLPEGWGFNLMVFDFGEKGSMFYISNAQRQHVVNQMREFIRRAELDAAGQLPNTNSERRSNESR